MNTRNSIYDSLNSGRQRRQSSMEDLEATLGGIEAKLDGMRARPEPGTALRDDMAERMRRISEEIEGHRHAPAPRSVYASGPRAEPLRQPETGNTMTSVAAELQQIRNEMARLTAQSAPSTNWNSAISKEMEAIKQGLGSLAREDTLRSVESQWNKFAQRPAMAISSDPVIESMLERIESIQSAVGGLPQSQTLVSLEEKIRMLASAVDQLSRRAPESNTAQLIQIEDRLDEISRAIVASSVSVQPSHNDKAAFERLEARLSSLNTRIDELISVDHSADVNKRIGLLANQLETIATRAGAPVEQMNRLTMQMEAVSTKISEMDATRADPALIASGLEDRLYEIAARLERNHEETGKEAREIFTELENRLEDMAVRLNSVDTSPIDNTDHILATVEQRFADLSRQLASNHAEPTFDVSFVNNVESRLEDITNRLNETTAPVHYGDPDALARLEMQVQSLANQLSAPREEFNPLISINPRLEAIEQSLTSSQEAILSAARQAAEDVIRSTQYSMPSADNEAALQLANDLKALEALARKSDERNTKTFEAIHDTLLKIVDRLNSVETTKPVSQHAAFIEPSKPVAQATTFVEPARQQPAPVAPTQMNVTPAKINLGDLAPSFDNQDYADNEPFEDFTPTPVRSPAEAALAAAHAARNEATALDKVTTASKPKGGFLSGLAAKVRRKEEPRGELALAGSSLPKTEPMLDEPVDPASANSPIEPGSGTPDLGAIMKRVRDERKGRADGPVEDTAKNDFLAAARRAAQAAAADAEILRNKSAKATKSSESGIANLLQRQRKPIMMVAFAALLALTGMQLTKAFLGGETQEVAVSESTEAPAIVATQDSAEVASVTETPSAPSTEMAVAGEEASVRQVEAAPSAQASEPAAEAVLPAPAEKPADVATAPMIMAPEVAATAPTAELPSADLGPVALREAAASGDAKALFEVGSRLADGRGVTKDLKAAAGWYEKAADTGFAPAQFRLGSFYEKGTGVERSAQKAKELYQLAAEQGNASAMHNLAVLHAMGAAGPVDNDTAAQWFVKAAELGVKDSQYNLGILAAKGLGVPQNLEDSYKWFALAAKAGDKDAATKRDEIANALRPEQLQKARNTAELWKAKTMNVEANGVEVPDSWKADGGETASTNPEQMTKAIRNIQAILNQQGFDAGAPDGKLGGKTKKAIAAYQKANGMPETGDLNEELIKSLLKKVKT